MLKSIALIFYFILTLISLSCGNREPVRNHVGDITFDPATDRDDFKVCNSRIYQYYNFGKGNFGLEKASVRKYFASQLIPVESTGQQNGYITIRFIVNCRGETDRFRPYEIDMEWKKAHFHPELTKQLLAITRSIQGWKPGERKDSNEKYDYYQYLTFKVRNGEVVDILP